MNRKALLLIGLVVTLAAVSVTIAFAAGMQDLTGVRRATSQFRDPVAAQAAGWELVPGLDHCFENPGVGAMGYHYINTALLDTELNPLTPEAMVYAPSPSGKLKFAAVEYIVPVEAWDGSGKDGLPELFGQTFHLNESLGVYVLHAWIWRGNPAGVFEDWNPKVSCP